MTAEVMQTQRLLLLISAVHCSSAGVVALGLASGPELATAGLASPPVSCLSSSRPYCAYATPLATSSAVRASPAPTSRPRRRAGPAPAGLLPGGGGPAVLPGTAAPLAAWGSVPGTLALPVTLVLP